MSDKRILFIFTRTPLHVGAGSSVGAIDQPVQRERHTGFPIIPASSLKGSIAVQWPSNLENGARVITKPKDGESGKFCVEQVHESSWLFGSDDDRVAFSGSVLLGEARILAFPVRSARGCFAWVTSPLILERACRDGVIESSVISDFLGATARESSESDGVAFFDKNGPLAFGDKIVLEDYTFSGSEGGDIKRLGEAFAELLDDPVWSTVRERLVMLSNGMMSFFARSACEVAQHVRINNDTGVAEPGALFNQENVPSETLFYSVVHGTPSRVPAGDFKGRSGDDALEEFERKVAGGESFQFGGDASTGLGFCSLSLSKGKN